MADCGIGGALAATLAMSISSKVRTSDMVEEVCALDSDSDSDELILVEVAGLLPLGFDDAACATLSPPLGIFALELLEVLASTFPDAA